MKSFLENTQLGQTQPYIEHYDPSVLHPIPRELSRSSLERTDFYGEDLWTAYELSWLGEGGKPHVAVAEFSIPATSPNLIESKSFKYYLNSFNQTLIASSRELVATIEKDLSAVAGAPVAMRLFSLDEFAQQRTLGVVPSRLLDELPLQVSEFQPRRELIRVEDEPFEGVWCSHLLKSNCPVTGQPDWASVWIGWKGVGLDESSLLSYIVAYRQHQDFHENCVERIYCDLQAIAAPEVLWVYARYTRRGGLDINPFRSSQPMAVPRFFAARQ
jgi:7-cyano-7-deazaguanine reductase